jgi:putative membrane protein insertion efficiency factor
MKRAVVLAIRLYQLVLSPFLGGHCRFIPSCSEYTREAVEKYGAIRGAFLGGKRLLKCHPFHAGGVDEVP